MKNENDLISIMKQFGFINEVKNYKQACEFIEKSKVLKTLR